MQIYIQGGKKLRARHTHRASSRAALGLQNLPLLSIFPEKSLTEDIGSSRASSAASAATTAGTRGELRGLDNVTRHREGLEGNPVNPPRLRDDEEEGEEELRRPNGRWALGDERVSAGLPSISASPSSSSTSSPLRSSGR